MKTDSHPKGGPQPEALDIEKLDIKHILVPVDFSERSLKMLRRAAAFATHFAARVTLLYVVESPSALALVDVPIALDDEKLARMAKRKLEVLAKPRPGGPKLDVRTMVRAGKPFQEICNAAKELKVDLLIIATHGYTGVEHVLLGSTAERVVRHATCPVLVCRAAACETK